MTQGVARSANMSGMFAVLDQLASATKITTELADPSEETKTKLELAIMGAKQTQQASETLARTNTLPAATRALSTMDWNNVATQMMTGMEGFQQMQERFQEMQDMINAITDPLDLLRHLSPTERTLLLTVAKTQAVSHSTSTSTSTTASASPTTTFLDPSAASLGRSVTASALTTEVTTEPLTGEVEQSIFDPSPVNSMADAYLFDYQYASAPFVLEWIEVGTTVASYRLKRTFELGVITPTVTTAIQMMITHAYFNGELSDVEYAYVAHLSVYLATMLCLLIGSRLDE